jgi:hypothetical protein
MKLVLLAAVISLSSCLSGSPEPQESTTIDTLSVDTIKADTLLVDTIFLND